MQNLEIQPAVVNPFDLLKRQLKKDLEKLKNPTRVQIFFYIYFLTLIVTGIVFTSKIYSSDSYFAIEKAYTSIYGHQFDWIDLIAYLDEPCAMVMAGMMLTPVAFSLLAFFNFFNFLFTCGKPIVIISAIGAGFTGGMAILSALYRCEDLRDKIGQSASDNLPQNAWPYLAAISGVFLLSTLMEYCWKSSLAKEWDRENEEERTENERLIESV